MKPREAKSTRGAAPLPLSTIEAELLSIPEAAKLLNKSTRQIYRYLSQGTLTRRREAGQLMLLRSEVYDLAEQGQELLDRTLLNRKTIGGALLRLRRLEAQMLLVNRILDLQRDPYRISDAEAALLYDSCLGQLTKKHTLEDCENWVDHLLRIDEQVLEQLGKLTIDVAPATKFYRLASELHTLVQNTAGIERSLDLQMLAKQLNRARKNLLGLVALEVEQDKREGYAERVSRYLGTRDRELQKLARFLR